LRPEFLLITFQNCHELVNVCAANRVIRNNADVFPPEAAGNTFEWLQTNPEEWLEIRGSKDQELRRRYGILS
jgi:hypothetical protein